MEYPAIQNDDLMLVDSEYQAKEPLPLSIFLIIPFLIGSVAVSALQGWNYAVIGLGVLCAVVFLLASVRDGFFVPTELKLFIGFFVWGILGLLIATYPQAVTDRLRTVFQLVIMSMIVAYYARNIRCVNWLLFAVLIGVLIVSVGAVITGEFARAEIEGGESRMVGFVMNANAFARAMCFGMAIVLYYFRLVRSNILKLMMVGFVLISIRFIIASGSRQGFLGMAVLIVVWFLYSYGRELHTRPGLAVVMLVGLIGLAIYTAYALKDTTLMKRFLSLEEAQYEGSASERMTMIREGIEMTLQYPIFGVGLSSFLLHSSTAKYAHNNYLEIFSTAGIPGGILYHMIYVLIFYRLYRLGQLKLAHRTKNVFNIFKALMYATLVFDLFVVSYYSKMTWIMLAIIIGYLNAFQRRIEIDSIVYEDSNMADGQDAEGY